MGNNKLKNDYYVYLHKTLDGSIFYVGKGRARRAYSKNSRNSCWHRRAESGFLVEFVKTGITETEAKEIERDLISKIPFLVNRYVPTFKTKDVDILDYLNYFTVDRNSPSGLSRIRGVSNGKYERGDIGHCGYIAMNGTWAVKFKMTMFKVHRIVWELSYGKIPDNWIVDHLDGNPLNNLIENLRIVPAQYNCQNRGKSKNNTSGVTGVSYRSDYNCYTASWNFSDKVRSKSFSVNKYGNEEAFRLACEYRAQKIRELNEQGAGYTERHGT